MPAFMLLGALSGLFAAVLKKLPDTQDAAPLQPSPRPADRRAIQRTRIGRQQEARPRGNATRPVAAAVVALIASVLTVAAAFHLTASRAPRQTAADWVLPAFCVGMLLTWSAFAVAVRALREKDRGVAFSFLAIILSAANLLGSRLFWGASWKVGPRINARCR